MKRPLLLAAVLATPLYLRQREIQKRQKLLEDGMRLYCQGVNGDIETFAREVNQQLKRFVDEINRAGGIG